MIPLGVIISSKNVWGLVMGASLGALAAQAIAARPAGACECYPSGWVYNLVSVESTGGAPDHTPFWPSQVHLDETPGRMTITSHLLEGHDEPKALWRVGAASE